MGFSLGAVASAALVGVDHQIRCGVLASAGRRLAPLLQRFGGSRYLRAMATFDPIRWIGSATARLLVQNGLLDRDFPPYDALARRTRRRRDVPRRAARSTCSARCATASAVAGGNAWRP